MFVECKFSVILKSFLFLFFYFFRISIGSLEYLGLSIATFVIPVAFGKYSINVLISITTLINGLLSLMIATTSNLPLIYFGRFG